MFRSLAIVCAALALGVLLSPSASAHEIVRQGRARIGIAASGETGRAFVRLQAFDPRLGTLREVRARLSVDLRGAFGVENLSDLTLPQSSQAFLGWQVAVPGGAALVTDGAAQAHSDVLGAFDGKVDMDGSSGASHALQLAKASEALLPEGLLEPAGLGPKATRPRLRLAVDLWGIVDAEGPAELANALALSGTVEVQLTYVYDPATPPPGGSGQH